MEQNQHSEFLHQSVQPPTPKKKWPRLKPSKMSRKSWLWLLIVVALLVLAALSAYFYRQYQHSQQEVKRLSNTQNSTRDTTAQLVQEVGTLTDLPSGETPTVATVTDASKLKNQPFFVNAQNGDKVLIYTQAKRAYLYRPSTNKIINIAPVNIGKNNTNSSSSSTNSTSQ